MSSEFPAGGLPPLARRQPLTDDVHEAIRSQIMDLAISPGDRLSIDGLARSLGVSPTPVREAMARLESEGLVVKSPRKGYRATELLTREQLLDLYAFRQLIEPWAAQRAAERIDPAGFRALEDELATATEPTGTDYAGYRDFFAHDQRFHALIADLSGSPQVTAALARTHCHLHIFRLSMSREAGSTALADHRAIAAAIIHADPYTAGQAMADHLRNSLRERAMPGLRHGNKMP